jgi:hypothetical protein
MPTVYEATSVIDLGTAFEPVNPPERKQLHRWARSRRVRVAVPIIVILILSGASAPAAAASFPQVAQLSVSDGADLLIHADDAYILESDGNRNVLRSYPLNGHGHRWIDTVSELPDYSRMWFSGASLIISMDPEQVLGPATDAFDPATGRRLWSSLDGVAGAAANGDIFLESALTFPMVDTPNAAPASGGWAVQRVSARSNRSAWTTGVPMDCIQQLVDDHTDQGPTDQAPTDLYPAGPVDPADSAANALLELCNSSPALRMVDLATGRERATRDLSTVGESLRTFAFGDVVVVLRLSGTIALIDGFAAGDLRPLWSDPPFVSWQSVTQCRSDLCMLTKSGSSVIDPRSGAPMVGAAPEPTGAVLIAPDGAQTKSGSFHQVASIGNATGVALPEPPPDDGSSWISMPAGTGPASIKKLTGVGTSACEQLGQYLACSPSPDLVTIWRLP